MEKSDNGGSKPAKIFEKATKIWETVQRIPTSARGRSSARQAS
jgi:hypothetical protein